ncbi:MAG: asparaginase [Acidobacteriota bacterium]
MTDRARRPTLLMVFTGGTISCTLDPQRGMPVPTLSGQEILARVPQVAEFADIVIEDFGRYPGPHMNPERVLTLALRVADTTAGGGIDGVVVTHGTDSIEETAFLLDRLLPPAVPTVLVGAMKLASDPCWDGAANLLSACQVAANREAAGRGTMVVMADAIHAATQVVKVHAESLDSFASPQTGPIGLVDRGQVIFFAAPEPSLWPRNMVDRIDCRVDLIRAVPGADGCHVRASLDAGAKGLVIEGLGRGNLPPELASGVVEAAAKVPVVIATRCPRGRALPMYGYEGGAATLRDAGVIFADLLPGNKARLLLMVLLAQEADMAALRRQFEGNRYD